MCIFFFKKGENWNRCFPILFLLKVSSPFLRSMFYILRLDNDETAREINRLNLLENVSLFQCVSRACVMLRRSCFSFRLFWRFFVVCFIQCLYFFVFFLPFFVCVFCVQFQFTIFFHQTSLYETSMFCLLFLRSAFNIFLSVGDCCCSIRALNRPLLMEFWY